MIGTRAVLYKAPMLTTSDTLYVRTANGETNNMNTCSLDATDTPLSSTDQMTLRLRLGTDPPAPTSIGAATAIMTSSSRFPSGPLMSPRRPRSPNERALADPDQVSHRSNLPPRAASPASISTQPR